MVAVRGNRARVSRVGTAVVVALAAVTLASCSMSSPHSLDASTSTSSPATPSATPSPTVGPSAEISIAGADVDGIHVTVAGFVTLVAEDGGSCEFDLTSAVSGAEVTATTEGAANGTNTSCGSAQVLVSQLSHGSWKVVLHYTSSKFSLSSQPTTVEVP